MTSEPVLTREQAEHLLTVDADDLFEMLVPQDARREFYSKKGKVTRGRGIFRSLFERARKPICKKYADNADAAKNIIDLMMLIGASLSKELHFESAVVFPMAALIVKTGLSELCSKRQSNRDATA
jgi:hypothetical protein